MLSADERETIIRLSDGDDTISIWTAQKSVIKALRAKGIEEISHNEYEGSPQAEFRLPADSWNVISGIRYKMRLTDEERERRAEHMRNVSRNRKLTPA